jgi:hypothetical protein
MVFPPWIITLADYLEHGTNLLVLAPLATAGLRWSHLTQPLRLLAGGLVVTGTLVAYATLGYPSPAVESLLWHVYTIVQTLFFGGIYALAFQQQRQRQLVQLVLLCFLAFALLDWGWLEQGTSMHAYTHSAQSVLLIGLSGLYLRQLSHQMPVLHLENHSLFLVSSGIVMYFSGTILLYVFAGHFISASDAMGEHAVSLLMSVVNLVQLGLFTLAFYHASQPSLLPSARSHE